ncbi:MAG TPA: isoaspartyl peptidase/L-asparaginase [Pirellulaceae bacterium]|nr:isoaspartyl peptidase/L-asparaginase [Pirellulaceae bacterium]
MSPDRRTFLQLAALASSAASLEANAQEAKRFAIAIHGGAGKSADRMPPEEVKAVEASLGQALDIGVKVLQEGGASLDAVEQVLRFLEDDPLFNAGRGAVFNAAGEHELDASIMDGKTKACGAVAAVRTVRHPISLSRLVMEKTRHVLLTSDGAEKFADEMRVERVENKWFDTDKQRRDWERSRAADAKKQAATGHSPLTTDSAHYGTVGCVALDAAGNLAAGTSTGGISNKKYGRVGDSPIVGAGTYADNATCAVSCTGTGEQFIRNAVAYDLSARLKYLKQPLAEAVNEVLHKTLRPSDGGLIALGADGTIVMDYSTGGMARAAADASGRREVKIGR